MTYARDARDELQRTVDAFEVALRELAWDLAARVIADELSRRPAAKASETRRTGRRAPIRDEAPPAPATPAFTPPGPPAEDGKRIRWTRERVIAELCEWLISGIVEPAFLRRHGKPGLVTAATRIFGRFDSALNVANLYLAKQYPDGPPKRATPTKPGDRGARTRLPPRARAGAPEEATGGAGAGDRGAAGDDGNGGGNGSRGDNGAGGSHGANGGSHGAANGGGHGGGSGGAGHAAGAAAVGNTFIPGANGNGTAAAGTNSNAAVGANGNGANGNATIGAKGNGANGNATIGANGNPTIGANGNATIGNGTNGNATIGANGNATIGNGTNGTAAAGANGGAIDFHDRDDRLPPSVSDAAARSRASSRSE